MDDEQRKQALGRNFTRALERSGMRGSELADRLGVERQAVSNWKKRGVSAAAAAAVADMLGVHAAKIADLRAGGHVIPERQEPEPTIAVSEDAAGYVARGPSKDALLRRLLDADLTSSDSEILHYLIGRFDQRRGD